MKTFSFGTNVRRKLLFYVILLRISLASTTDKKKRTTLKNGFIDVKKLLIKLTVEIQNVAAFTRLDKLRIDGLTGED